jgi:transposase
MELTEAQWELIEGMLPGPKSGPGKKGRPGHNTRDIVEGIFWILRTGAPWHDLPDKFPSYQTCHRRFQKWVEEGQFQEILKALWDDLRERGGVADVEGFIDGTYVPAKKGATSSAAAVAAWRPRSWQWQTARVFHSLSVLPLETDTKLDLLMEPWIPVSLTDSLGNLSETRLTIVLRLFVDSKSSDNLSSLLRLVGELEPVKENRTAGRYAAIANGGKSKISSHASSEDGASLSATKSKRQTSSASSS